MSYDLILKHSNVNWAREGVTFVPRPIVPVMPAAIPDKLTCTPEEKTKLAKIAAIKIAAGKGNKGAMKEWHNLLTVGIPTLKAKAVKGDPKAKRNLQCLKASGLFATPVAMQGVAYPAQISGKEFVGAYPTQILGNDLNDDELAVAREGGSSERSALARMRGFDSEIGRHRKRTHHLKKIVKRAARGDINAFNQMQQVKQRLSQRAALGDPRANTLLQKINQWYTQYQGTAQSQYPSYPQTPYSSSQQPYQTPYSPSQQPYSPYPGAPSTPADEEQELATSNPEL